MTHSIARIGVVVVTYNRLGCLKVALRSFEGQTRAPLFVLVVDNGSTDGTGEFLDIWSSEADARFRRLVVTKERNGGGSGGFHDGMEAALGLGADWIWLSDDDAYPKPDAIEAAGSWIADNDTDSVSAICGAVINGGAIDVAHRRRVVARRFTITEENVPADEYAGTFELNALSFVGAIVKGEAALLAGLPISEYFIYFDDTEYSLRLGEVGRILCVPEIEVAHDTQERFAEAVTWKEYYGCRNRLDCYRRHFPKRVFALTYLRAVLGAFKRFLLNKDDKMLYFAAVKDFAVGNLGLHDLYRPGWECR